MVHCDLDLVDEHLHLVAQPAWQAFVVLLVVLPPLDSVVGDLVDVHVLVGNLLAVLGDRVQASFGVFILEALPAVTAAVATATAATPAPSLAPAIHTGLFVAVCVRLVVMLLLRLLLLSRITVWRLVIGPVHGW